ncbi:S8 family serine peptidase [Enterobacter sp. RHBSTW-00994]|uniref:S8 family serine peptidase n=1 Tax=Enterobacter sp. RHBSTW-00994 TaxID=2742676 RepID=UPI0015EB01C9|nr:S8 family serine peptidase [Enterobacter sp. RHBSTW-00994]QLR43346.1 S8 family serine peptidase [Enterobacter sp. RHBSTW-00994]
MKKTLLALFVCTAVSFSAHATVNDYAREGNTYLSVIIKFKAIPSLLKSNSQQLLNDSTLTNKPLFHPNRLRSTELTELTELNQKYGFDRYQRITLPSSKSHDIRYINNIINELNKNPDIEIIYPEIQPASLEFFNNEKHNANNNLSYSFSHDENGIIPDFRQLQDYMKSPDDKRPGYYMGGVNRDAAYQYNGNEGDGISIVSMENEPWNEQHVNLPEISFHEGNKYHRTDDHDTSSVGIMAAKDIGTGVRGLTTRSRIGFTSWQANNLYNMIPRLKAGDVVQMGMQTGGGEITGCKTSCFVPQENAPDYYDLIKALTDKGVYVIEAAGNGNVNLDHPAFKGKFDVNKRDSGAIIAGAFCAKEGKKAYFSTYGSRVTSSAWGCWDVVTTGTGDLYNAKNMEYTASFAGTSSANPIIAGVVASLSSIAKAHNIHVTPAKMREILQQTGTPLAMGDSSRVGTQPDMEKAVAKILALSDEDDRPAAPVADAGADFTVEGTTDIAHAWPLDASASQNALSYTWTIAEGSGIFWLQEKQGGHAVKKVNGPKAFAFIPANTEGKVTYLLTVKGKDGQVSHDEITVTITKTEKPLDNIEPYDGMNSYPIKCTAVSHNGNIWFNQWYVDVMQEEPGTGGKWGAWREKNASNNNCR